MTFSSSAATVLAPGGCGSVAAVFLPASRQAPTVSNSARVAETVEFEQTASSWVGSTSLRPGLSRHAVVLDSGRGDLLPVRDTTRGTHPGPVSSRAL